MKYSTFALDSLESLSIRTLFFELIRVSVGSCCKLSLIPSDKEWKGLYLMAQNQALIGTCFYGIKQLPAEQLINLPLQLKMKWLGETVSVQKRNDVMNQRCLQLQRRLNEEGFNSCILKGQGVASIYSIELSRLRQPGDIDIWVKGGLRSLKLLAKKNNQHAMVTEQHADFKFFDDAEVEVHYLPTMLRNPFANRRLQKWMNEQENRQFININKNELCVPTFEFNLIYLLIHTFRHIFGEGIGLRQIMDYYMLLRSETISAQLKSKTMKSIRSLHIDEFTAGLMWVLKEVFALPEERMLCVPNKKHGMFILNEIMIAGNMGHYDKRLASMRSASKIKQFVLINLHTFRLFKYYPQETFFSPFTRMCTWAWRKNKGYI